MTTFTDFGLAKPITTAIAHEGHTSPTPIQARAIPAIMTGRDVLGIAQTGSGKTAAFALPTLHRLFENPHLRGDSPRALVLAPTRELATQIHDRFKAYGARTAIPFGLAIGGAAIAKQKARLRRGVDVLVATPGRLEDLLAQKATTLDNVELLVLDEVDQMLDMGFIHAIRRICAALPENRQSVFFTATMPKAFAKLAEALLDNPIRIEIDRGAKPKIEQSVQFVKKTEKASALMKLVTDENFTSGLVFCRTKHGADKIVRTLTKYNVKAQAIHGNRSQSQRERALRAFKRGEVQVLVATDIAARGIDVAGVSHVVNFDLPEVPEIYVHRIGRTARAGASGVAVSLCSPDQQHLLRAIEKFTGETIAGPERFNPTEDSTEIAEAEENIPARAGSPRNRKAHDPKKRPTTKRTGSKRNSSKRSQSKQADAERSPSKPRAPKRVTAEGERSETGAPTKARRQKAAKPRPANDQRSAGKRTERQASGKQGAGKQDTGRNSSGRTGKAKPPRSRARTRRRAA